MRAVQSRIRCWMAANVVCTFVILFAATAFAAPVNFVDDALESAVRQALIDLGQSPSTPIDSAELVGVGFTELEAAGLGMGSLSGLEFATDLERVNVNDNAISSLSPLSSLTNLSELEAGFNQISDLSPLAGLTGLTRLELGIGDPTDDDADLIGLLFETGVNQLSDLSPLASLTNLSYLNVGGSTGITSIAVLNSLTGLGVFVMTNAAIADFTPLSSLSAPQIILLGNNGMQNADVSNLAGLTSLVALALASEPALTDLSPLSTLNLTLSAFVFLPVSDFSFMSGYTNAQEVAIAFCEATAVPDLSATAPVSVAIVGNPTLNDLSGLAGLTSVQSLELSSSALVDISPLSGLTGLELLDLSQNSIDDLQPLIDNPGLGGDDFLNITANDLSGPPPSAACDQLSTLVAKFNSPNNVESDAVCGDTVTLTVNRVGNGFLFPDTGTYSFPAGQNVYMIALTIPGSSSAFQGYTGDVVSTNPFITIPMDGDRAITATFNATADHTLSFSVNGDGSDATIFPQPGAHRYVDGRSARLFAGGRPGGPYFSGYTGDVVSNVSQVDLLMDADKSVTVNFVDSGFDFSVDIRGRGRTNLAPFGFDRIETAFASGLAFGLEAIETDADWSFDRWEGDIGAGAPGVTPLGIVANQDRAVTVYFRPDNADFALYVLSANEGIPQNADGFTVPAEGGHGYASGTPVEVEAFPRSGHVFAAWEGDVSEEDRFTNPVTLTMDQDREIRPIFSEAPDFTLTVNIVGGGEINFDGGVPLSPLVRGYQDGESANLSYVPSAGTAFLGWSGDIDGQAPDSFQLFLNMNQDRTVTATFGAPDHVFTLSQTGTGNLFPAPGVYGVVDGTSFNISAGLVADSGFAFQEFQGDVSSTSTSLFLTITEDTSVEAVYDDQGDFTLTLGEPQGTGNGFVSPAPGVYSFFDGQAYAISATPDENSFFAGWSGDVVSFDQAIGVLMDADKTAIPTFSDTGFSLTLDVGNGGFVENYSDGVYRFDSNATPTLAANPDGGFVFDSWTGDLPNGADANDPVLPLPMTQDRNITANFVSAMLSLTINATGNGTTDPAAGVYQYSPGTNVTVRAIRSATGAFASWTGDVDGAFFEGDRISVTMDQDREITANFGAPDHVVTLQLTGTGQLNPPPGSYGYFNGEFISLNATTIVNSGFAFQQYQGDLSSTATNETLEVTSGLTIEAVFVTGDVSLTIQTTGPGANFIQPEAGVHSFLSGRAAFVSANPGNESFFNGFSGDVDTDNPFLNLTLDQDTAITADYVLSGFTLNLAATGPGGTSFGTGNFAFGAGTEPVVEAFPDFDGVFDLWQGDLPNGADTNAPQLPVLMDQDRSITAVFLLNGFNLNLSIVGQGATSPEAGLSFYETGTSVNLIAFPAEKGGFIQWQGDIGGANPNLSSLLVNMDQERNITAVFEDFAHTLTVNHTGNGTTEPEGTSDRFDGEVVNLSARLTSGSGDAFSQWSGDISDNAPDTTVVMDATKTVTAEFVSGDFDLNLTTSGDGNGSLSMAPGIYSYLDGQSVTLIATPDVDSVFNGWSGDTGGEDTSQSSITLTMDQNRAVAANFDLLPTFELTVNAQGPGTTVPSGTTVYFANDFAAVSAIPDDDAVFVRWEGDIGDGNADRPDLGLIMDRDREITAVFDVPDFTLTLGRRGTGFVVPAAGTYAFFDGEMFTVEALESIGSGFFFTRWDGDIGEGDPFNPLLTLTMDQDRTVNALFEPAGSIYCQTYAPSATPFVSNAGSGFLTYDTFDGLTQTIAGATWWGIHAFQDGEAFPACTRDPDNYRVIIAEDDAGEPGNVVYTEDFAPVKMDTGDNFFDYDIYAYEATFTTPVALASGWISIHGIDDEGCWLLWSGSDLGDGATFQVDEITGDLNPKATDSAFCLIGGGPIGEGEGGGEGEGAVLDCHTADQNCDNMVNLSELLRVIQFYNSNGYSCAVPPESTEDGYQPGPGVTGCTAHASDYNPQDFAINLSELLRLIQFYNSGGYFACPAEDPPTEDGFCPGMPS